MEKIINMREVIRIPWRRGITRNEFFTKHAFKVLKDRLREAPFEVDIGNSSLEKILKYIIIFSKKGYIVDSFRIFAGSTKLNNPYLGVGIGVSYFIFSVKDLLGIKDTDNINDLKFVWH